MSFKVDHERLTEVAGWRPFFSNEDFAGQDTDHIEKLNVAGDMARARAGLPPLGEQADELAQFTPGRDRKAEVLRRKREGAELPHWLKRSDWERMLTTDWAWPGNVPEPKSPSSFRPLLPEQYGPPSAVFRPSPKRTKLLIPRDPNTGLPLAPEILGPPHPLYRNVPYYDGLVPMIALVWWQRTEAEWRKPNKKGKRKDRPPVGISNVENFQKEENWHKRPGVQTGRNGPLLLVFRELFRQAEAKCPSAKQLERLVEDLRNVEFPKKKESLPAPVGP